MPDWTINARITLHDVDRDYIDAVRLDFLQEIATALRPICNRYEASIETIDGWAEQPGVTRPDAKPHGSI